MSIIKCRECKAEVSDQAESCPHCGIKKPGRRSSGAGSMIFWIIVIVAVFGWLSSKENAAPVPVSAVGPATTHSRTTAPSISDIDDEQELLARVAKIPATRLEANRAAYAKLMKLNPSELLYQQKHEHYDSQIKAKAAAEDAKRRAAAAETTARIKNFGNAPAVSSLDGSYREVERYLEAVAHNPESVKIRGCTKVFHTEGGWLVGCDYTATNAFGGTVRASNWFTIAHGKVLAMREADAYRPN